MSKTNETNASDSSRSIEGLVSRRYIFDGFCHRAFDENTDGWRDEQKQETKAVRLAREIIDQHEEINELRRENWRLRKELGQIKESFFG